MEPATGRPIPGTSTRHAAPQVFTNDVMQRMEDGERITIWSWKSGNNGKGEDKHVESGRFAHSNMYTVWISS